jgi:hypothetical protein
MFDNKTWGALPKAWKAYVIAKNKYEYDKTEYYAAVIQKLQNELGLAVSSFADIGLSALKFYSSRYSDKGCLNNDDDDNKEIPKEELLQDDDNEHEYFDGDFNNRDRFTS